MAGLSKIATEDTAVLWSWRVINCVGEIFGRVMKTFRGKKK
jgi:hypothetical protein